jgi:hypothetical protein
MKIIADILFKLRRFFYLSPDLPYLIIKKLKPIQEKIFINIEIINLNFYYFWGTLQLASSWAHNVSP